ncbi:hypothetical protein OSTOST_15484, partial [Ostertagia ostertagi]
MSNSSASLHIHETRMTFEAMIHDQVAMKDPLGAHIDASGLIRLGFRLLLLFSILRWQKSYDELKQLLLKERFLADDELNAYLLERLGPRGLERSRTTFLRLCPTVSQCGIVPPFIHYESRQI